MQSVYHLYQDHSVADGIVLQYSFWEHLIEYNCYPIPSLAVIARVVDPVFAWFNMPWLCPPELDDSE